MYVFVCVLIFLAYMYVCAAIEGTKGRRRKRIQARALARDGMECMLRELLKVTTRKEEHDEILNSISSVDGPLPKHRAIRTVLELDYRPIIFTSAFTSLEFPFLTGLHSVRPCEREKPKTSKEKKKQETETQRRQAPASGIIAYPIPKKKTSTDCLLRAR